MEIEYSDPTNEESIRIGINALDFWFGGLLFLNWAQHRVSVLNHPLTPMRGQVSSVRQLLWTWALDCFRRLLSPTHGQRLRPGGQET